MGNSLFLRICWYLCCTMEKQIVRVVYMVSTVINTVIQYLSSILIFYLLQGGSRAKDLGRSRN